MQKDLFVTEYSNKISQYYFRLSFDLDMKQYIKKYFFCYICAAKLLRNNYSKSILRS